MESLEDLYKNQEKYLPEEAKIGIEINGRVENLDEKLQKEILTYLLEKEAIRGLQDGEEYCLVFPEDSYLVVQSLLDGEMDYAWLVEDEEIVKKIKGLVSEKT